MSESEIKQWVDESSDNEDYEDFISEDEDDDQLKIKDVIYSDVVHIKAEIVNDEMQIQLKKQGINIPSEYKKWVRIISHEAYGSNNYYIVNYLTPKYNKEEILKKLSNLRGLLIKYDGKNYTVVSKGLKWLPEKGLFEFAKSRIKSKSRKEKITITEALEGINFRAWYDHDMDSWLYSTHRLLRDSRWGCQFTVLEIAKQTSLLDLIEEKGNTNIVYWFLLRHETMETIRKVSTEIYQIQPSEKDKILPGLKIPESLTFDEMDWSKPDPELRKFLKAKEYTIIKDNKNNPIVKLCTDEYLKNLELWGNEPSVSLRYCALYWDLQRKREFKVLTQCRFENELKKAKQNIYILAKELSDQANNIITNGGKKINKKTLFGKVLLKLINWHDLDKQNNIVTPKQVINQLGDYYSDERMKLLRSFMKHRKRGIRNYNNYRGKKNNFYSKRGTYNRRGRRRGY